MLKPGDKVHHLLGVPEVDGVTVVRVSKVSNTISFDEKEPPYFLAEYWCTSFLGHVGMPCIFCGFHNTFMRLADQEEG